MTNLAREARLADEGEYAEVLRLPDKQRIPLMRELGRKDLYFLLTVILGREDLMGDWFYARCREVEAEPDGCLDLWAREHGKSSIITYGLTFQDIIRDPEVTIGIFSYTKDNAVYLFLTPLKETMEESALLKTLYPDIFWRNPASEAPLWSVERGLTVRRQRTGVPTVSAWGIIKGQPTGSHFDILVYDDIVNQDTVTDGMVVKATDAWSVSTNLGTAGGRMRVIGTRYAYNDTYAEIINRKAAKLRLYPATVDGTADGDPVYMSREELEKRRKVMGPYIFAAQMLLDPVAGSKMSLNPEWLNYYPGQNDGAGMNVYMLVDPADSKKKSADYTVFSVVGIGQDGNKYLLDLVRDRMDLGERIKAFFRLHRKWRPNDVGWESYGKDSDIQAIELEGRRINYNVRITKLAGRMAKKGHEHARIERLVPDLQQGRWYFPECLWTTREGKMVDLIRELVEEEMRPHPYGAHDDGLDAISRIYDMDPEEPFVDGRVRGRMPMVVPPQSERHFDPRAW